MTADRRLRRELEQLLWTPGQAESAALAYRGPADFLLQHGERFDPRPRPPLVKLGARRACYGNAIAWATARNGDYVEGYALPPLGPAMHHAWCAKGDRLIELTWPAPGLAYLGVRFSVERADDATWNGDASVLDDFKRGWPLLRERWEGEPEIDWPPSERLEMLRRHRAGEKVDFEEFTRTMRGGQS